MKERKQTVATARESRGARLSTRSTEATAPRSVTVSSAPSDAEIQNRVGANQSAFGMPSAWRTATR
jgi:hypothetical protein